MRALDRISLEARYETDSLGHYEFAEPLGVQLPRIQELHKIIFDSLDEKKYGIGWWETYADLDFKRRILISDHLIQSLPAIQTNCIEAKLSALELYDYWDQQTHQIKDAVKVVNGKVSFQYPERVTRLDDLHSYMADLHLKGFLSSVCSAIDCLAAVCVGVMGLQTSLVKIGYPSLLNHLRDNKDFAYANPKQKELLTVLESIEGEVGPNRWLTWLFDFRNMAMHRGRRITFNQIFPHPLSTIQKPMAMAVPMLVSNPAVSEMESLKDGVYEILSEKAEDTINDSLRFSIMFIEKVTAYLDAVWKERIDNPELIIQPKSQWKTIRSGSHNSFSGYRPGTISTKMDSANVHPSHVKRMRAASLNGNDIKKWK
jgi:hypothetical protein